MVKPVDMGDNLFAASTSVSAMSGNKRAKMVLGRGTYMSGFFDGMEPYAKAFEARKR